MQLSSRKHEILIAAIDDYIKDAVPITSSRVQERQKLKLSTATLRNELNALEEMGFLRQIHTSGGRVPTAEGYKYYVNDLMKNISVDSECLEHVKQTLESRTKSLAEIASEIANIISKATSYPTAVLVSGYDKLIVEGVTIVPLVGKQALVLIQTNSGYISNNIEVNVDKKTCEDASNYFTKLFSGKTIGFLTENIDLIKERIQNQLVGFEHLLEQIINNLKQVARKKLLDVKHENSLNLIKEGDPEDMKKILALISDEEKLSSSLEENSGELVVELDDNNHEFAGLALVKAPIIIDGIQVASIGVFGPQRMDYASITAALKLVVEELKGGQNGK